MSRRAVGGQSLVPADSVSKGSLFERKPTFPRGRSTPHLPRRRPRPSPPTTTIFVQRRIKFEGVWYPRVSTSLTVDVVVLNVLSRSRVRSSPAFSELSPPSVPRDSSSPSIDRLPSPTPWWLSGTFVREGLCISVSSFSPPW